MGTATATPLGMRRVLEADPDLGARLSRSELTRARTVAVAPCTGMQPGTWTPAPQHPRTLGLLVLDGVLARYASVEGHHGVDLIGHGDVLRPWDTDDTGTVAFVETWEILTPTRIALLDADFSAAVSEWPGIIAELLARSVLRSRALVRHRAVSRLPRLESRILLVLWEIGDRWGRTEADGVSLPLPITQRLLADLVSASRQRVNLALADLSRARLIERRADRLLLRHRSLDGLAA